MKPVLYYKYPIFILLAFYTNFSLTAQTPAKLRSTLSSGSSNKVIVNENKYSIKQSIGQTSVIGAFQTSGYKIIQGFIQPASYASTGLTEQNQPNLQNSTLANLNAVIFPNPFSNSIAIHFHDEVFDILRVSLEDFMGRNVLNCKYSPTQELTIDLNYLTSGLYVVKVQTDNKLFITKLIKK